MLQLDTETRDCVLSIRQTFLVAKIWRGDTFCLSESDLHVRHYVFLRSAETNGRKCGVARRLWFEPRLPSPMLLGETVVLYRLFLARNPHLHLEMTSSPRRAWRIPPGLRPLPSDLEGRGEKWRFRSRARRLVPWCSRVRERFLANRKPRDD